MPTIRATIDSRDLTVAPDPEHLFKTRMLAAGFREDKPVTFWEEWHGGYVFTQQRPRRKPRLRAEKR
jgi:hypothetical protein